MKCEEAAEFVSALCDGELIPSHGAEHIGECGECHALLNQYVQIGAELRRVASVEMPQAIKAGVWEKKPWRFSTIWQKGWETMRIPKLAFVTLVLATLALGSRLVMTKVRAQSGGPYILLTITPENGRANRCPISMTDSKLRRCAAAEMFKSGFLKYEVQALATEGDRVHLGLRSELVKSPGPFITYLSVSEFAGEPQEKYWFEPGQKLEIKIPGFGLMTITGQFFDHVPTLLSRLENDRLDPKADELRIYSPLLLRDNKTVFDFEYLPLVADHGFKAVEVYEPGLGRYIYSLAPLRGAVQGKVEESRISYELDGHKYQLLTGAPVALVDHVWVLHQPQYKPSQDSSRRDDAFFGGTVDPKRLTDLLVSN
jgi:hypothetical protein